MLVAEVVAIAILGLGAVLAGGNRLNHTGPVDTADDSAADIDLGGGSSHEDSEDHEEDELVHFEGWRYCKVLINYCFLKNIECGDL